MTVLIFILMEEYARIYIGNTEHSLLTFDHKVTSIHDMLINSRM